MPVRVRCVFGFGGRLAGPPEDTGPILVKFRDVLQKDATAKLGAGWPAGGDW